MLPGKKYTPDDFVRIASRRKWLVIMPFLACLAASAAFTQVMPNLYMSNTVIQIVPQRVPSEYVRSTVTSHIEDRLQSISQQILSRKRLEGLIIDFNLYPERRKVDPMEDVVDRMRRDITVKVIKGDAFSVAYVSYEPRLAMRVAERLATMFIEENLRDREVLADGTSVFLETQLEAARKRLVEHEQKLEDYKRRFAGELPTQVQANLQVLQNAQMQLQALLESVNRDRDRRLLLEKAIADASVSDPMAAPPPTSDPAQAGTTQQQLEAARTMLNGLLVRLKPEHPDVVRAKRLVSDLEKKSEAEALQRPLASGVPAQPVSAAEADRLSRLNQLKLELINLDKQLTGKGVQEQQLRQTISAYQARVEATPTREAEMVELMRDYTTLQNLYTGLLAKLEDSKMAANLEKRQVGEQFKVLDPARVPERPSSPNRPGILAGGAAFGLVLGLALVVFLEYRDTSVRNEGDVVSTLALPVLAMIPLMVTEAEQRKRRRSRLLLACTVGVMVVVCVAGIAITLKP